MSGQGTWKLNMVMRAAGLAVSMAAVCAIHAPVRAQPVVTTSRTGTIQTDADAVPIRKITLYRSGVGFFERSGMIQGDARLQLRFKTEEINDIIKTMVLVNKGGGRIDSVSYGSKEPLNRRLASFGVNMSGNPSVPQLLDQLRGASIKVSAGGEQISGTILGVEQRRVAPHKDQPSFDAPYLNLVTAAGTRSIAIADLGSFEILDKQLAEELNKALAALAEYRADRSKTVDVNFSGKGVAGAREVVMGYVHEMPVWKTTYRIILPQEATKATRPGVVTSEGSPAAGSDQTKKNTSTDAEALKSKVALQGWAIVENNTDQDWHEVRLGLVSGRPVSFRMDLYEPLFVTRPYIPVPMIPGVAPRAYSGGMDESLGRALKDAARYQTDSTDRASAFGAEGKYDQVPQIAMNGLLRRKAGGRSPFTDDEKSTTGTRDKEYAGLAISDMTDYAAAALAAGGEVGEVFQFELDAPVTLERQRSAMIPIMTTAITGRRVSIYSAADGAEHPMRGVEITNDSNLQLIPGPITVFDGSENKSAYAGNAQIGHVGPGDKRLLAYAVDLDVAVLTKPESTSNLTKIRIVHGVYEATYKVRNIAVYGFENKDKARPRTIIVEHPKMDDWELIEPKQAAEVTQGVYRFEVPINAAKTGTLRVTQERVQSQTIGLDTWNREMLVSMNQNGQVSQAVMDACKLFVTKQGLARQIEREIAEIDRQLAETSADQGRIRENMSQIDHNSQLYTRYMTKLNEQESKLEDLTERRFNGQEKLEAAKRDLEAFVVNLNVE